MPLRTRIPRRRSPHLRFLAAALLAPCAAAQLPTPFPLPGTSVPGGPLIASRKPAVDGEGGFAVLLSTGQPPFQYVWGAHGAAAVDSVLRAAGTVAGAPQQAVSEFGIGDGSVVYAARATFGATQVFAIWRDDQLVVREGDVVAGGTWGFVRDPRAFVNGAPAWTGRLVGMSSPLDGHFFGQPPVAAVVEGQTLTGLPGEPIDRLGNDHDISGLGSHTIATVEVEATADRDAVVVLDGAVLTLGNAPAREGTAVPPSIGGLGGEWSSFPLVQTDEKRRHAILAYTENPGVGLRAVQVRNGIIARADGDVVDGVTLDGGGDRLAMNEHGLIAYDWGTAASGGVQTDVFFEDQHVLAEGDAVDWDGDGVVDPRYEIHRIELGLVLGDDGVLGVESFVEDTLTQVLHETVLRVDLSVGASFCSAAANSTGSPAVLRAIGTDEMDVDNLFLCCGGLPAQSFGLFAVSLQTAAPTTPPGSQGHLCLGGTIGRYVTGLARSGPLGRSELRFDATAVPLGPSAVSLQPGDTVHFQFWYRDANPGQTSNFSNGVSVTLR